MFDLPRRIAQLSAAVSRLLRPRRPAPAPRRPRPELEPLSSRVLFSANPITSVYFPPLYPESAPAVSQTLDALADAVHSHEGDAYGTAAPASPEAQAVLDGIKQLSAGDRTAVQPTVAAGELTVNGAARPSLDFNFGARGQVSLVFGENAAGAPGEAGRPSLLAVGVTLWTPEGEKQYVVDCDAGYGGRPADARDAIRAYDDAWRQVAAQLSEAESRDGRRGDRAASPGPAAAPEGGDAPGSAAPAGRTEGGRIADGLGRQEASGSQPDETVETDGSDPGADPVVLVTVDGTAPDAKTELIPLKKANLAVVPAYLVADAPADPAPRHASAEPDLPCVIVGPDETAAGAHAHAAASGDRTRALDHLFTEAGLSATGGNPSAAAADAPPPCALSLDKILLQLGEWLAELPRLAGDGRAATLVAAADALLAVGVWRLANPRERTAD